MAASARSRGSLEAASSVCGARAARAVEVRDHERHAARLAALARERLADPLRERLDRLGERAQVDARPVERVLLRERARARLGREPPAIRAARELEEATPRAHR